MAEWYGASASGSVDLGFDSESGQTNDLKIGMHSQGRLEKFRAEGQKFRLGPLVSGAPKSSDEQKKR